MGMAMCDVNRPQMNCIEFFIAAKKLSLYKFMSILMLSTETQESKKAEVKAAGANAWKVKIITPTSLLSAVSKFFSHEQLL